MRREQLYAMPVQDIAAHLGQTPAATANCIFNALRKIRQRPETARAFAQAVAAKRELIDQERDFRALLFEGGYEQCQRRPKC